MSLTNSIECFSDLKKSWYVYNVENPIEYFNSLILSANKWLGPKLVINGELR